jgi:UMF1 family MFS transporter
VGHDVGDPGEFFPPVLADAGAGMAWMTELSPDMGAYITDLMDGVDTIVMMAADYGKKLGFETTILIGAILMIQFIAFPAALVFGRLGERYGPKRGIWIAIVTYMGVTAYASIMTSPVELLVLAAIIGLVQGGIQSLSRSLFSLLIPQDKNAEFFGFYNVVGKAAAVIGPILVGFVTLTSGNLRMGIASILILFALALVFFKRVDEPHPH